MARKKVARKKAARKTATQPKPVRAAAPCSGNSWQTSLAVASFVLVLLRLFPALHAWVGKTSVWWFVLALLIFAFWPRK